LLHTRELKRSYRFEVQVDVHIYHAGSGAATSQISVMTTMIAKQLSTIILSLQKLLVTTTCYAKSCSQSKHSTSLKPCRPGSSVRCSNKLIRGPMLLKYYYYLCDSISVEASRIKTNTTTVAQDSRYTGCVLMELARRCICPEPLEMRLRL